MTKNNPYILCPSCHKFDNQFSNGSVRIDVLTVCECDYEIPECKENATNCEDLKK